MRRIGVGAGVLVVCGALAMALLSRGEPAPGRRPVSAAVEGEARSPVRAARRALSGAPPGAVAADPHPPRTPTAEAFDALAAAANRWSLSCAVPDGLSVDARPPDRVAGGVYHVLANRPSGRIPLSDRAGQRPVAVLTWDDLDSGRCAIEPVRGTRRVRGVVVFPDGVAPEPARVFACEGEPFVVEPGQAFEADVSEGISCVLSASVGEDERLVAYLPLASDQPGDGLVLALAPRPEPEASQVVASIEAYGGQDEELQLWIEAALGDPALSEEARAELRALAVEAQRSGDRLLEQIEGGLGALE